jgi:hypothetical protein
VDDIDNSSTESITEEDNQRVINRLRQLTAIIRDSFLN